MEIGAQPGNNLTLDSWNERFERDHPDSALQVEGTSIEISVRWESAKIAYSLSETLEDFGGHGFDFRFGGHMAYVEK